MRVIIELLRWYLGAALLLIIDVFAKAVVLEWLQWDGTTKNDWFFTLVPDRGGMDAVLSPPLPAGDVRQAGLERPVLRTESSAAVHGVVSLQWPCIERNQ